MTVQKMTHMQQNIYSKLIFFTFNLKRTVEVESDKRPT